MPRPETDEEAALLGRIALQQKLITPDQLEAAMRRRGRSDKKLGVIMLEMGVIDEFQLGKMLALQQRHLKQLQAKQRSQPRPRQRRIPTPGDWVAEEGGRGPREPRGPTDPRGGHGERPSSRPHPHPTPRSDPSPPSGRHGVPSRDATFTDEAIEVDLGHDAPLRRARPASRGTAPSPRGSERPMPGSDRSPKRPGRPPRSSEPPPSAQRTAAPPSREPSSTGDEPLLEPRNLVTERSRPVEQLEQMLTHAARMGASDVHLSPGNPVKMRRFGRLTSMTDQPLTPAATEKVLRAILNPWQQRRLDGAGEVDLAYAVAGLGRFRSNVYRQISGMTGVFHFVPEKIPSLQELGLPTALAKLTNYAQGLILLTGPAGCGKTTTLASLVDIINEDRRDHILTIEDPIEYIHRSKRCVVNQRQVGRDTISFARALRGALREDPDIICIGELRDLETISLALSAAETGHLVLGTLHTGSSIGTITRIVGAFPPNQQSQIRAMMSESLRAIISQRLVPTADGQGQAVALEILYVNNAVGALIRDNRTFQLGSILQTGKAQGMMQLDESLRELVRAGRVRREDALVHCEDPRALGGG